MYIFRKMTILGKTRRGGRRREVGQMSKRDWLWVMVGGLFFALVNFPLLQIFNADRILGGLPLLVWYLFGIWSGALVMLVLFARRKPGD